MFQLVTQNAATLDAVAGVDNGLYALGDFAVINGSATTTSVTTAGTLTGTSVVVPASSTVLTAGSDVIPAGKMLAETPSEEIDWQSGLKRAAQRLKTIAAGIDETLGALREGMPGEGNAGKAYSNIRRLAEYICQRV